MKHIISLGTYPSMSAAFAEHTRLLAAFVKAHKRNEKVELFLSTSGDPKGAQVYEIRLYSEPEQAAEAQWFVGAAKEGVK